MIAENLAAVRKKLAESCTRRTTADKDGPVELIAVTKNHGIAAMREAIAAGVTTVGENRVQEAQGKYEELHDLVKWHLIGHLQTNKAAQAVKMFDLIHSVDSERLLAAIERAAAKLGKRQDILLQVNLAREESKSGIFREELPELIEKAVRLEHIRLCGLMCIAPKCDDAEECRPLFREMYKIFRQTQAMELPGADIRYLSMGMTNDYHIAVEEGANMVRVGTAIFGARRY